MNVFGKELVHLVKTNHPTDVIEFFKSTFEQPLQNDLLGNPKIPAEEIRHKLQQIEKIKSVLLNLAQK